MATPTPGTITAPAGTAAVYAGRYAPSAPQVFSAVNVVSTGTSPPTNAAGQSVIINLHGSNNTTDQSGQSRKKVATLNPAHPLGAFKTKTTYTWHEIHGGVVSGITRRAVWPRDDLGTRAGGSRIESNWLGLTSTEDGGALRLLSWAWLDAMIQHLLADPLVDPLRFHITGGSMGGWGSAMYGIHHPTTIAAVWPDRPRFKHSQISGQVSVHDWDQAVAPAYPVASAPSLIALHGGGSSMTLLDLIAHVSNTANRVPWVGWVIGRNDGYMPFQDHIDFSDAMIAAGRGFAWAWNNGDHGTGGGSTVYAQQIFQSYAYEDFVLNRGYPVFSEHSLDDDPRTDLVGGINIGLGFRNVAETSGTWSCQVRSVRGACTVKVKPWSLVYTGTPTPALVTIPAANTWVTVSF